MTFTRSKLTLAAAALGVLASLPFTLMVLAILRDSLGRPEGHTLGEDLAFCAALIAAGPVLIAASTLNMARATAPRWAVALHLVPLAVACGLSFFTGGLSALGGGGAVAFWLLLGAALDVVAALLTLAALLRR